LDHSKKSSWQAPLAEQPQDISADPEKQFMIRESYHRMLAALEQLDEGERDILSLAANGDLSYREIGKITGISEANVKIRVHRARIKLRKIFKEEIPNGISK
jgi:RNA polymerase sigma-70 factor, ECF subfamily